MHSEHTWPARARTPRERQEDYCVALLMKGERLWTSAEISRDHGVVSSRTRHVCGSSRRIGSASGGLGTARDRSGPLGTHGDAWGRGGRTRGRRLRKVEVPVGTLRVRLPRVRVVRRSGSHALAAPHVGRQAEQAHSHAVRERRLRARHRRGVAVGEAARQQLQSLLHVCTATSRRAVLAQPRARDRSGPLGTARDGSGPAGMLVTGVVVCNGRYRKLRVSTPAGPRPARHETTPLVP